MNAAGVNFMLDFAESKMIRSFNVYKAWCHIYTIQVVNVVTQNIHDRYCFDNYYTYFVPVFKYCYSDSRNL